MASCKRILRSPIRRRDMFVKMNYLSLVIDSYNKYLRRKTKYAFTNIERIMLNFMMEPLEKKSEIIDSISQSINKEDRLDLARFLSTLIKDSKTKSMFERESLKQRLKVIATVLSVAIPIIISIIQLLESLKVGQ